MSDKVSSVVSIAPVAAPGRIGAFVQPGSGSASAPVGGSSQGARNLSVPVPGTADVVTLQSLQAEHTLQTGPGRTPNPSSVSQAEAQATLYAAQAAAQAQARAQAQVQQKQQSSLQEAASTLSSYFSDMHPDVSFRVEQQGGDTVVTMVNSLDGKVLQTISGDEARQLAHSLFGKSSVLPQTA